MRHVWLAGAVAAAALLFAGAVPRPAEALPISKLQSTTGSDVTLAGRGGHGGGGGGGMGRGIGGGHARGMGGGFGGGGKAFRSFGGSAGPKFHSPRFGGGYGGGIGKPHIRHRHRGGGIRIYPRTYGYAPYYYGDYYYDDTYYDDACAWLRRKALRTNSRYWWRRYHRCRDSY